MRKDQIPDFIEEIIGTGCPITAVGHDMYAVSYTHLTLPTIYSV